MTTDGEPPRAASRRREAAARPAAAAPTPGVFWRRRLVPVAAALAVVLAAVLLLAGGGTPTPVTVARSYARDWARGDFAAMYAQLTPAARAQIDPGAFTAAHHAALATATATRVAVAGPVVRTRDDVVRVPLVVTTRLFGTVRATAVLPFDGRGAAARVAWRANLVFPGLRVGERLTRETALPPRATLLARDGSVLAQGPARTPAPAVADVAAGTVGHLGPIAPERAAALTALGVPPGAQVGASGLERALDAQLLGHPGGRLLAGSRQLARSLPRQGEPVRTTIAPGVERAALAALAGRLGGVVALQPRTGEVLGYAGIAFTGLQPPGSTMKIVTLTGVLEKHLATPETPFPVQTQATLEGVALSNANGESCGGTLAHSFAESCNSVFAPLGARLGAAGLVDVAQRYGFNAAPAIAGAATPSIPPAAEIGDDLAVGSSAIGQGRVLATTLQMATVAATIADRGRRPRLTLSFTEARAQPGGRAPSTRVTSARVARVVERLMLGVVTGGTGVNAQIPGVKVAGKTGTAELQDTKTCATAPAGTPAPVDPEACASPTDGTDTDAWFAAEAPAGAPRVAVGVLVVRAGAGGETAAPVAKQVLLAALRRGA